MPLSDKKRSSGRPIALYVVPSLAIFVSLLSVLWGGRAGPVVAAEIWGGPTDSAEGFRGRVRLLREDSGMLAPQGDTAFIFEARQGSHRVTRQSRTGPDGWAEVSVPRYVEHPLKLTVRVKDEVVAQGTPKMSTERWHGAATRVGGPLAPHDEGDLRISLSLDSVVLGVPFWSQLRLEARFGDGPASGATYHVSGESLEVQGPQSGDLDQSGRATFSIRPTHHVAALRVRLTQGQRVASFERTLPVVPGSMSFERTKAGLVVRSPIVRDAAWYTFLTESERLPGGRLPLSEKEDGVAGLLSMSEVPRDRPGLYLMLSSEADGRSPSTVGFPLDGQQSTFEAFDGYLVDGLPRVRAREEGRARRLRWTLGAYAAASGLLSLILFWVHVKRADIQLEQNLERVGAEPSARSRDPFPLLIAVLCLFFAFSATVLWIVAR